MIFAAVYCVWVTSTVKHQQVAENCNDSKYESVLNNKIGEKLLRKTSKSGCHDRLHSTSTCSSAFKENNL